MPEDDWDLETEDDDSDDSDDDDRGGDDGGGDDAGDPLSPEEREAIRALRETGMTAAEAIARARRDYEQEAAGRQPRPPAGQPPDEETDDPDAVLTKGEARRLLAAETAKQRQEARFEAMQMRQYELMQGIITDETAKTLGEDLPQFKWKAISDEVARRLGQNVKLMSLNQRDFTEEVRKVTKGVLTEERKTAARIAGAGSVEELDVRLDAQRTAGESGARGGTGKRSAKESRLAEIKKRVEEPGYGVSETRKWPSDQDIEDAHQAELAERLAGVKGGRSGR